MRKYTYGMKSIQRTIPDKKTVIQFGKFALVGVLNTAISLLVFYLLYNLFAIDYVVANFISYVAGVINSFIWNKLWVFHPENGNILREMLIFLLVFGVSYAIQYICLLLLVEHLGVNPNWAQLPAMGVYTLTNYILNRYITFKNNRT